MNDRQCPLGEHGTVCTQIGNLKEALQRSCKEHGEMWASLKGKIGIVIFLPTITLLLIIIGTLYYGSRAFEAQMMTEISEIKTNTRLTQERLEYLNEKFGTHLDFHKKDERR